MNGGISKSLCNYEETSSMLVWIKEACLFPSGKLSGCLVWNDCSCLLIELGSGNMGGQRSCHRFQCLPPFVKSMERLTVLPY